MPLAITQAKSPENGRHPTLVATALDLRWFAEPRCVRRSSQRHWPSIERPPLVDHIPKLNPSGRIVPGSRHCSSRAYPARRPCNERRCRRRTLGFAAFTFLYGALIGLSGTGDRVKTLMTKLRRALYATVFAVVSAAVLSVLAYISIEWKLRWVGDVAVALALIVLLVLSGVAVYMAVDVYRERAQ